MCTRSLLLSTVLFGGVVAATLTMQPGTLRADDALTPQGSWTVSRVEAKQSGAVPYCALTRRFGNGSVLTFARNPRNEGSLAIDFPDAAFQTGKELTIDLLADSEIRSFKTAPVSEHSIIVRMGEDNKFHQALEKSGQLAVSVADKTMTYAMPDMSEGMQDLSACIGQGVEPAAGDHAPEMAATFAPTPGKKPVPAPKPALDASPENADLQKIMEENIRLRTALERERREFENRFQKTGENTSATAELAEKARLLELENGALKSKMPVTHESGEDAEASAVQEISMLQQENSRLKNTLDEQIQRVAMLEKKSTDKAVLTTDDAVKGQVVALKDQIARLEADNEAMKKTIAQKEDAGIRTAAGEGSVSIASDNWNLEQAAQRFNEAEREIRRLGFAVEQERAKCMVEKKDLEYMLFDPKIADKEQIAHLTVLEEELAQAKRDLENAGVHAEKTGALESRVKELDGRIADLSAMNESYETQIRDLEGQLASAHLTASREQVPSGNDAPVGSLPQEISSLNAQISAPPPEKTATATQLSRIQPAADGGSARAIAHPGTTVPAVDMDISAIKPSPPEDQPSTPVALPVTEKAVAPAIAAAAAITTAQLMSAADIDTLLRQAGVATDSGIQKLGHAGTDRVAYRWQTQGLFGTAEQKGMESPSQFDRLVRDYLNNTKSRCAGQFASMPTLEEIQGNKRISAYEIACLDKDGNGASAALTFYSLEGKTFTTVAHETLPASMDIAMDARDRIVGALRGGNAASR